MTPLLVQEVDEEPDIPSTLQLTPVEATLRRLLLDVANHIDESPMQATTESHVKLPDHLVHDKLTLRFTGGWVRDKLLGIGSHDIDVAINKMTGYQFGLRLKEYLEIPGNPEKYGLEGVATTDKQSNKAGTADKSKIVGGLHKIEANPEKSKHLETVTTKILGLDIDLVNLRKETYTDESRNPQMEFGTPEEDALRRDATINAMFYNINTEQIEDFTGRGFQDLRDKQLRTPLDPYQTFKDDPLRVLRLIRFSSRLGYVIDSDAEHAMKNPEIQDALRRKISRERIGIEIAKALRGPDPAEALFSIFGLGLYEIIFSDPTLDAADQYRPDIENWDVIVGFLNDDFPENETLSHVLLHDEEERYLAWLLVALVPYRDAPEPESTSPGLRALPPIAAVVVREGIKATNKVCDIVTAAVRNCSEISRLVDKFDLQERRPDQMFVGEDASARDVLGLAIRRWGASWRSQVMYALLTDLISDYDGMEDTENKYTAFVQHLQELDLLEAYSLRPLIDGKTLAKALNTPTGPWMKDALEVVIAYQLRHPDTANADDAIAEVQHKQRGKNGGELNSSLVHHFLKLTIRPLFIKAKPTSVTDTGRKNTTTILPKKITSESMDDSVNKPWKSSKDGYALDLLRWSVAALDESSVEEVWPLIIPPLLTLVDDWETKFKLVGAELVKSVLEVTPPALLARTGLGEVFEEAIMPCLAFLPPITPKSECIPLLNAVYPTLMELARVRYANNHHPTNESRQHIKFLDTIIRKGVIYGYTQCTNYPHIISTLFAHLVHLLNALGINSVKHLKYILPMLTETLSHPLAEAQMETLSSATKALQAVILNGWPRMAEYRGEVLKGLTLCWINLSGTSNEDVVGLRDEMRETVKMLGAAVGPQVDFGRDCERLLEAEPRLASLLAEHGRKSDEQPESM